MWNLKFEFFFGQNPNAVKAKLKKSYLLTNDFTYWKSWARNFLRTRPYITITRDQEQVSLVSKPRLIPRDHISVTLTAAVYNRYDISSDGCNTTQQSVQSEVIWQSDSEALECLQYRQTLFSVQVLDHITSSSSAPSPSSSSAPSSSSSPTAHPQLHCQNTTHTAAGFWNTSVAYFL